MRTEITVWTRLRVRMRRRARKWQAEVHIAINKSSVKDCGLSSMGSRIAVPACWLKVAKSCFSFHQQEHSVTAWILLQYTSQGQTNKKANWSLVWHCALCIVRDPRARKGKKRGKEESQRRAVVTIRGRMCSRFWFICKVENSFSLKPFFFLISVAMFRGLAIFMNRGMRKNEETRLRSRIRTKIALRLKVDSQTQQICS